MTGGAIWGEAFRTASADAMGAYRDSLLGPVFRPWADLLLDVSGAGAGERLLDVATGPGTVAQAAAAVLGTSGLVTACDISPAMLEIARSAPVRPSSAPIEYLESPAAPLAAADESHDVVTCQQGLQFFPDRAAAIAEMARVLRPGGRVALAVWASIEDCPSMAALERALREELGDEPADRYRSGPWGMPAATDLAGLLSSAGFLRVHVEARDLVAVFPGGASQLEASLASSAVASDVAAAPPDVLAALSRRIAHHLEPLTVGLEVRAPWRSNVAVAVRA